MYNFNPINQTVSDVNKSIITCTGRLAYIHEVTWVNLKRSKVAIDLNKYKTSISR